MESVAAERVIRGEGTPEAAWQQWLDAARIRPLSNDLRALQASRLVIVSPHPDDEILACGGLLAMQQQRGAEILIIAVTDGEASHHDDDAWTASRLAEARNTERDRGLAQLDIPSRSVMRLGLPDGAVAASAFELRGALDSVLRDTDVVITTWRFDGHPDHEATGHQTARACADNGSLLIEAPVWMWHWSRPGDPKVPWSRLRAVPLRSELIGRKTRALAEHATQLEPQGSGRGPVLGASMLARVARPFEYFFV